MGVRVGVQVGVTAGAGNAVDDMVSQAAVAAGCGLESVWAGHLFELDALTALAVIGREVPGIALGTFIVPTYPRHPIALAGQALATQAACRGRLTLGVGVSHQMIIEGVFGYSYHKPARHLREYLSALVPLLRDGQVRFAGETLSATTVTPITVAGAAPIPVIVAALGPVMLGLAGRLADGVVTWMVGPRTVDSHVVPSVTRAASAAGRPPPRIVVGLPVCVTGDGDTARQRAADDFAIYAQLPAYASVFEREGVAGPAEVAVVGTEKGAEAQLRALADAGATELIAVPFGDSAERRRTVRLLGALAGEL